MAAVSPIGVKTPEQVIDEHADAIADVAKRLFAENTRLRRVELDLQHRLSDALEEVQTLRRQNESMLSEFQALRIRTGKQRAR